MSWFIRMLTAFVVLAGLLAVPVMADTPGAARPPITIDKRKLLVQPRNADGSIEVVSFWEDPILWARDEQQNFYSAMSGALRGVGSEAPLAAAATLMLLSFGYGVFHAAGPGHGKAVISGWLLATENQLRRGIFIAFLSSMFQAVTATVIVSVLLLVVASVGAAVGDVQGFLESGSWAMIGAMGAYLIWTALRPRKPAHREHPRLRHQHHARHRDPGHRLDIVHVHEHRHDEACDCGHAHVPEATQLKGGWSLAKAFTLAFAVGIRPCTGAIAVLVFANSLGLFWAGVASTFVMALGTFITVSAIAALAVYSKKLAMRLAARDDRWLGWAAFGLRLGGGTAIAAMGTIFFLASLGASHTTM